MSWMCMLTLKLTFQPVVRKYYLIMIHVTLLNTWYLIPHFFIQTGAGHTYTVYPKKYAHGFCFAVLCCGYTLTDFPISIRLTSLALWQSNDCPSASKATLMNMDKYFIWIYYERLHNHNKAKHNKTKCIFLGIYCTWPLGMVIIMPANNLALLLRNIYIFLFYFR